MFIVGDRVRLAVGRHLSEALGTVIGFNEDDTMVRWEIGVEKALAPASLAPVAASSEVPLLAVDTTA